MTQLLSLEGRTAVVTGGARGVGAAICRRLAELGAAVVVADVDAAGAEAVAAANAKSSSVVLDVTDRASIGAAVDTVLERHGRLDVWVNNAGVYPRIELAELTQEQWDRVLAINLGGPLACAQAVTPHMAGRGSGVIVNIASLSAYRVPVGGLSQYVASKAGLVALTRSLAVELGPKGIRVVAVAPCFVTDPPVEAPSPLGRSATPDDIARMVALLATDAAAFVAGTCLPVDGGELSGMVRGV
jgi:NAD(P)-dependent dehydrogenase (short-subunit alcohol dehydrogenase family)